jgi:hypothetical protein
VSLPVRVVDPLRLVDQVQVYFRREGVKIFTVVTARADENVALVIPALSVPPDEKGYALEYFVRAVDRWEGTLVEAGSAKEPLRLAVAPASSGGPLLTRWWFWTVLGAVAVVGAGLAIAAGQGSGDSVTITFRDGGTDGGG